LIAWNPWRGEIQESAFIMKLHLPSFPQGHHVISETLEPVEMDLDTALFPRQIDVEVQLDRHDPYLRLDCHISAWSHRVCDRCASDFDAPLSTEGKLLFVVGAAQSREKEGDDEIEYVPPDCQDIDLSADLRDILMLSIPLKSLCREDCKGLCPHCGQNLNEGTCTCVSEKLSV
jgi:uncharacterized protein